MPTPKKDITGRRYGKLTAIKCIGPAPNDKQLLWECECDCGNKTVVRGTNLRFGTTHSCGCLGNGSKRPQRLCHLDQPYGARGMCRSCYQRWHYRNNKEHYDTRAKKWREENKERHKQNSRQYLIDHPEWFLWHIARRRARKRGHDFCIEISDIYIPKVCPVLGIPLVPHSGRLAHNSPSIDRIDNSKGYVKGNIVVVSFRANSLKNNATVDELRKLAGFYTKMENA